MTGVQEHEEKYKNLASGIISNYTDLAILKEYYYYILSEMSYSSAYTYLNNVKNFLVACNKTGNGDVTLSDYSSYLASKKQYTSSYVITVYTALEKFSSFLKASEIEEDYMVYIKRPKFKEKNTTKQKREKKFLNKEEIRIFLDEIKNSNQNETWRQRDLTIALVFLNSGIRCSALQKLDVTDVNMKNSSIYVTDKGEDPREIILSDKAFSELIKWINIRNNLSVKNNALFVTRLNTRITTQSIYNLITKYGEVIDEKIVTPHTLRGTYGTNLYDETLDVYFVQDCMHHASPKTTELYIRGQKMNNKRKAAAVMDNIIFN